MMEVDCDNTNVASMRDYIYKRSLWERYDYVLDFSGSDNSIDLKYIFTVTREVVLDNMVEDLKRDFQKFILNAIFNKTFFRVKALSSGYIYLPEIFNGVRFYAYRVYEKMTTLYEEKTRGILDSFNDNICKEPKEPDEQYKYKVCQIIDRFGNPMRFGEDYLVFVKPLNSFNGEDIYKFPIDYGVALTKVSEIDTSTGKAVRVDPPDYTKVSFVVFYKLRNTDLYESKGPFKVRGDYTEKTIPEISGGELIVAVCSECSDDIRSIDDLENVRFYNIKTFVCPVVDVPNEIHFEPSSRKLFVHVPDIYNSAYLLIDDTWDLNGRRVEGGFEFDIPDEIPFRKYQAKFIFSFHTNGKDLCVVRKPVNLIVEKNERNELSLYTDNLRYLACLKGKTVYVGSDEDRLVAIPIGSRSRNIIEDSLERDGFVGNDKFGVFYTKELVGGKSSILLFKNGKRFKRLEIDGYLKSLRICSKYLMAMTEIKGTKMLYAFDLNGNRELVKNVGDVSWIDCYGDNFYFSETTQICKLSKGFFGYYQSCKNLADNIIDAFKVIDTDSFLVVEKCCTNENQVKLYENGTLSNYWMSPGDMKDFEFVKYENGKEYFYLFSDGGIALIDLSGEVRYNTTFRESLSGMEYVKHVVDDMKNVWVVYQSYDGGRFKILKLTRGGIDRVRTQEIRGEFVDMIYCSGRVVLIYKLQENYYYVEM